MTEDRSDRFIEHLETIRDREDKGALAALRRGLGKPPGEAAEMYPYIFPWTGGMKRWDEESCFLVAALFAYHPERGGKETLGSVFRTIRHATDSESVEQRFVALLNADRDDLPVHLRHAVSLAKSKDVPIDWKRLLSDIRYWGYESRSVQRQWAREFWGNRKEEDTTGEE
jgi:CRISPR system Cascade subunit CasB